ncbi:MAG: hypothetical protein PHQ86_08450 [Dehalococcoidales bacterium]|nr:hypothetical protein [Dehalococcoidales bacterium]
MDRRIESEFTRNNISDKRQMVRQPTGRNEGGGVRLADNKQSRALDRALGTVLIPWTDETERKWMMRVPQGETDASIGIVAGPPDTSSLGLPEVLDIALHNELFNRGLLTWQDVKKRPQEIQAALQSVLKIDSGKIMMLYREI